MFASRLSTLGAVLMAKSPENMTPDERLKRIRSLERKVSQLERDKDQAERDEASVRAWAEKAWQENRHLMDIATLHWSEKQEIRRAAGLEPLPKYTPLAQFDHDSRQWVPIPEEDDREPQPSDGPDYHADHASWEQRRAERQRRAHVPAEVPR